MHRPDRVSGAEREGIWIWQCAAGGDVAPVVEVNPEVGVKGLRGGERGDGQDRGGRGCAYTSTNVGGHLLGGLKQRRHGTRILASGRQVSPEEFGAAADDGLGAGVEEMADARIEVVVAGDTGSLQAGVKFGGPRRVDRAILRALVNVHRAGEFLKVVARGQGGAQFVA